MLLCISGWMDLKVRNSSFVKHNIFFSECLFSLSQDTHSVQPRSVPPAKCLQEKQLWSVWTPPVTLWKSPVTLWDTSCHPLGIPTASGTHRRLAHGSQEASRPSWLPLYSAQAGLLQRKALARGTEQLGGFLWLLVRPRCHKPPSVPRLGFL